MRNIIYSLIALLFFCQCNTTGSEQLNEKGQTFPLNHVNPLIGTATSTTESALRHSHAGTELRGQTFPAVGVPFGMTQWTPQTNASEKKCLPPYQYEDSLIQGFRGSHWMSGSCTQDYGSLTLMAMQGNLKTHPEERASAFSHAQETATPSYYSVLLEDDGIQAEVTALSRAGILQFTPQKSAPLYLLVEPNSDEGEGFVEIHPEKQEIVGYNPAHRIYQGWGEPAGFSGYFVVQFEQPFESYGVWQGENITEGATQSRGEGAPNGAYVQVASGEKIRVKVGTSFTGLEQARENLQADIPGWDFEQVQKASATAWQEALQKVQVKGGTEAQKTKFYTALYHTMILPRVFSDVDGMYPAFDGGGELHRAQGFDYYADFSMWDTYRGVHPLHTILHPKRSSDMVNSLVNKAKQGDWLPIFPSWNSFTAAMIGDHVTAMIGDAWMKGIDGFDQEAAYHAMRKNAFFPNPDTASYRSGKGRRALDSYLKYGYIPMEDTVPDAFHKKEQVSRTLEYAYDDFVLSQIAKKLGQEEDYEVLIKRAKNYQNVFDTTTGYVRGRYADGSWVEPFDPVASRASFITEGSPFQYTWYVPHDVAGLMQLMGGKEQFISQLDHLFDDGYYWHGNEPGHQTVYLYPYAGAAWKTQERVRTIIREEYSADAGGLSGNEDAGQMSAWLAFSMMGFYPVSPGMPYYVLGSPVFEEIAIQLPEGKTFTIAANNNSEENRYIQSATLNGESFDQSYLWHETIMQGGELVLEMGNTPNKEWAVGNVPPSMGGE